MSKRDWLVWTLILCLGVLINNLVLLHFFYPKLAIDQVQRMARVVEQPHLDLHDELQRVEVEIDKINANYANLGASLFEANVFLIDINQKVLETAQEIKKGDLSRVTAWRQEITSTLETLLDHSQNLSDRLSALERICSTPEKKPWWHKFP